MRTNVKKRKSPQKILTQKEGTLKKYIILQKEIEMAIRHRVSAIILT